jgi:hypothetical protein
LARRLTNRYILLMLGETLRIACCRMTWCRLLLLPMLTRSMRDPKSYQAAEDLL